MAQNSAVVEPLDQDILSIVACMVIDAQVFPRPSIQFHRELVRAGTRILVLRPARGERPMGFCSTHRSGDTLHITALATDPEYRRRGGGRALLEAAISLGKRLRVAKITLEVGQENSSAIALYEGAGFTAIRTLLSYYGPGEDALGLTLLLAPGKPRKPQARQR
jgi:ribosomal protein S18 acetylase RimI-like enzyme